MMDTTNWKVIEAPTCPHCKAEMEQMDSRHLDWESPYLWVCFNNDCTLFKKGWNHMMESYGQLVSYRFMIHPQSGDAGVIPAFSQQYLHENIKSRNSNYEE
jgi:hypothetical protein